MKQRPEKCMLCGAAADQQAIRSDSVYGGDETQAFWQCAHCDAIYLFPMTTDSQDKEFYEDQFDKWMAKRSGDESWSNPDIQFHSLGARELPLRRPWMEKYCHPGSTVLEIGSSSGFLLKSLQDKGCTVTGVELSHEYRDYAQAKGIKTVASTSELASGEQFDILLHYYVLEHVSEPLSFLKSLLPMLKPGGKMIFEVPNGNDPLTSLYKVPEFEKFYWWRAHHWYFTERSLRYLLSQLGRPFEVHPGQRYDLSNHMHWMKEGKPGGMKKFAHVFSPETEKAYAEDLKRSGHCDYLIGVIS